MLRDRLSAMSACPRFRSPRSCDVKEWGGIPRLLTNARDDCICTCFCGMPHPFISIGMGSNQASNLVCCAGLLGLSVFKAWLRHCSGAVRGTYMCASWSGC